MTNFAEESTNSVEPDEGGQEEAKSVTEIIEEETGVAYADYVKRHSSTSVALNKRLGKPVEFLVNSLKQDEAFHALVAQTEKEVDIANIIKAIVPIILGIVEKFIFAF